jgi:hypothetical protein
VAELRKRFLSHFDQDELRQMAGLWDRLAAAPCG